jgi:hypothetical protein
MDKITRHVVEGLSTDDHITKALDALKGRTAARLTRDVEGKHVV